MRKTKDVAFGFFACFFFVVSASWIRKAGGITQVNARFNQEESIRTEFVNLYDYVQAKQFKLFTGTPTLRDLGEREVALLSTGAVSMVFRSSSTLWFVKASSN